MDSTRRPVAVVVGATSTWQADGRNTQLAHGKGLDDSDLPSEKAWLEHFPVDIILTF